MISPKWNNLIAFAILIGATCQVNAKDDMPSSMPSDMPSDMPSGVVTAPLPEGLICNSLTVRGCARNRDCCEISSRNGRCESNDQCAPPTVAPVSAAPVTPAPTLAPVVAPTRPNPECSGQTIRQCQRDPKCDWNHSVSRCDRKR